MKKTPKPYFSVVIPALNEEKLLPELLKDLSKQTFKDFEVLVVDGHSEDKTVEKAKSFVPKLQLTVVSASKRNVSFQRNLGAKHAQADWLLFMDADNRLPVYFLEGIKYQLSKHKKTDIFTTLLEVRETQRVYKAVEQAMNFALILTKLLDKPGAYGALIGCKKIVTNTVKFQEEMGFSEDGEFVNNSYQEGFTFSLFREPRFYYSMRRLKAEGTLQTLKVAVPLLVRYALGDDMKDVKNYLMIGGQYYEKLQTKEKSTFTSIQNYIKSASKKQLEQARSIFRSLRDLEL